MKNVKLKREIKNIIKNGEVINELSVFFNSLTYKIVEFDSKKYLHVYIVDSNEEFVIELVDEEEFNYFNERSDGEYKDYSEAYIAIKSFLKYL